MIVIPYKTPKVVAGSDLFATLDASLPKLQENSIVVVTSKIVSICQGRIVNNDGTVNKEILEKKESQYYIRNDRLTHWGIMLTINGDILIANAGIDESNGNGYFVLWPKDIRETIKAIWEHLKEKFHIDHLGVIITDSRISPLRWGTSGIGIAWCGFEALKNYIDTPDIFGRHLRVTYASVLDGLSAAAVLVMGEGNEQTPLAVIRDVPFVRFQNRPPTQKELAMLKIDRKDDIYSPLTDTPLWEKGGQR